MSRTAKRYPDAFSRAHDAAYRRTFANTPPMINELYVTVSVRANVVPALRILSRLEKRTARDVLAWQKRAIEQLDDINRKLAGALKRYRAELLQIFEREPDKHLYSEPAKFFGLLLNGKAEPVPVLEARLYNYLPSSPPFFSAHGEQGELRGADWSRRFAMVELRECPRCCSFFPRPRRATAALACATGWSVGVSAMRTAGSGSVSIFVFEVVNA